MLIYAGLLFVFVAAPVHLLAPLVEYYGPLNLKVSYAAPAAQIPLELLCFHLALLTLLERLKKRIGDGQRWYLSKLCQKLSLETHLLPADGPELNEDALDAHNAFDAAAAAAAGRQRAPPERWAWGDERPSLREGATAAAGAAAVFLTFVSILRRELGRVRPRLYDHSAPAAVAREVGSTTVAMRSGTRPRESRGRLGAGAVRAGALAGRA